MKKAFLCFLLLAAGCGPKATLIDEPINNSLDNISCPQSENYLFDVMYEAALKGFDTQDKFELQRAFEKEIDKREDLVKYKAKIIPVLEEFLDLVTNEKIKNQGELLKLIAELEIGDSGTPIKRQQQDKLKSFAKKWQTLGEEVDVPCDVEAEEPLPANPSPDQQQPNENLKGSEALLLGLKNVIRTAYQSCDAAAKSPMTAKTANVVGVSIVGKHSDGVGSKRQISNLRAVQDSHYYLQGTAATACFNVREDPLIYDYGGKPKTSSADNSSIDLFSDAGTGTDVLGIDCSGLVFSAIASAGLKLHPDKRMKAILVNGVSSTMLVSPTENGLNCFAKASLGKSGTLRPADIVAIPGHVFMVESVGADPLGINKVASKSECAKLTNKNFDFVLAQSSPSKGGIGINRMVAKDYFDSVSTFRVQMIAVAKGACEAKFSNKDIQINSGKIQVTRFTENPKCIANRIVIEGEECVNSCVK